MSLDDIINNSAIRHGNHSGHDPNRHFGFRFPVRKTPYSISQSQVAREALRRSSFDVPELVFDHCDVQPQLQPLTKLYISNLDRRVSNDDILLLFSEEGELERHSIHYDQFGRSKGTAEVVFTKQSDALAAIKKYNNMNLDGKPLQIELVGTSLVTPAAAMPLAQSSLLGSPNDLFLREEKRFGGSTYHNYFTHLHFPRNGREQKNHIRKVSSRDIGHGFESYHQCRRVEAKCHFKKLSVKDLDEDLEKYRSEAMQIKRKWKEKS